MWHMHYDEPQIQRLIGLKRLVITPDQTREQSAVSVGRERRRKQSPVEPVNVYYYPLTVFINSLITTCSVVMRGGDLWCLNSPQHQDTAVERSA